MNPTNITSSGIDQATLATGGQYCESVEIDGETYFRIANVHALPEFMMTMASSSDHWMFISSFGALTAGRKNANNALFPYYSVEKITDSRPHTGPLTIVRLGLGEDSVLWRPFYDQPVDDGCTRRNLYKNRLGTRVCLEESRDDFGLTFRYHWQFSQQFGFIRSVTLLNDSNQIHSVDLLDGLINLMPYGINQEFQLRYGVLADAYKKNEASDSNMGLYYLSSIPTDRAEPSEGLRTTVVWSPDLPNQLLLSTNQVDRFLHQNAIQAEQDIRGTRGAFLMHFRFDLPVGGRKSWQMVADINQDQTDVVNLKSQIASPNIRELLKQDVADNEEKLHSLISRADGFQFSANRPRTQRHQSNVMFNIMRGGLPLDDYNISTADLKQHIENVNRELTNRHSSFFDELPDTISREQLVNRAAELNDPDLQRIAIEYLPLVFSRRHGDPTRPWNRFSINSHVGDESPVFDYEGNWRDIFQNWEALAFSYPRFVESMICRFINASTADGYNPYRLTKTGFDWECPEPDNPWSNIGYWCDHQIIYLCKLLEFSRRYFPSQIDHLLSAEIFVYANVPYRIKASAEIFADPRNTVDFDDDLNCRINTLVDQIGNDGKLLPTGDGQIQHANLLEKLLLTGLIKMTNFVPDGGIWLNTQRPEWNDANNALVGYGLSVVTTCYLHRYFQFLNSWLSETQSESVEISEEIHLLLNRIDVAISPYLEEEVVQVNPSQRCQITRDLAKAGSDYRERLYQHGFSGKRNAISIADCQNFLQRCIRMLHASIASNRRSDGLYHAYNLMSQDVDNELHVERLYEMLEGQVAALSSGCLSIDEVDELLTALRKSSLYRPDQDSYLLYPNRILPRFEEKNTIPVDLVNQSRLLKQLIDIGDVSVIRQDANGNYHFNGDFRNNEDVRQALNEFKNGGDRIVTIDDSGIDQVCSIFENLFCHHRFTGRSGTFFAYEGLGSIYWHMVSKLLLAIAEIYVDAEQQQDADAEKLNRLKSHFESIRKGIGAEKTVEQYGAFPFDPYSHTPGNAGVKQPGMTGQVKEDIISRWIELGVRVRSGQLEFSPSMLDLGELVNAQSIADFENYGFNLDDIGKKPCLVFTVCSVPICLVADDTESLVVHWRDSSPESSDDLRMTAEQSASLFNRDHKISRIVVRFKA